MGGTNWREIHQNRWKERWVAPFSGTRMSGFNGVGHRSGLSMSLPLVRHTNQRRYQYRILTKNTPRHPRPPMNQRRCIYLRTRKHPAYKRWVAPIGWESTKTGGKKGGWHRLAGNPPKQVERKVGGTDWREAEREGMVDRGWEPLGT